MSTAHTSAAPSAAPFRYAAVTFDCPDPAALARFYGEALGLPVVYATDPADSPDSTSEFVLLGQEGAAGLGFNRLADYRRPTWPDPAQEKQAHIEVGVDDVEAARTRLLALGATEPGFQPDPDRWHVLLDPAGHPFCVTAQV